MAADLGLDSTTASNDVGFQGAFGRREDDGVDEAPNGFSGFGAGVGMLERLREVGHLLPVELRHSWVQERRRLVG